MGYSEDDRMIRVDFFKSSGKWYVTEAVKWTAAWKGAPNNLIHDAFHKSLDDHFKETPGRLRGMLAVCLEPYHEHSHPITVIVGGIV